MTESTLPNHTFSRTSIGRRTVRREPIPAFRSKPPSLPSKLLVVPEGPIPPSTPLVVLLVSGLKVLGVAELGTVLVLVGVLEVAAALMHGK